MLRTSPWKAPALAMMLVSLAAASSDAVSTSFWRTDSFRALAAGSPSGTSVLHEGSLVAAPRFERHELPDAQYVWSAQRSSSGGPVYAVSGTPGRLLRLDGGSIEVLAEEETADYPALAVSPDGDVYVGTAPGGIVYRLGGESGVEAFFDTHQGYVWSMAYSPEHGLVVGTGDSACVFVVSEDGSARSLYSSSDASVTALAVIDGRIIAGTAPEGMLLDVTPGGVRRALYDSHYEEIPGIASDGEGRVLFAATTVSFEQVLTPGEEFGESFGEGSVYALTDAGGAVELWYSDDAPITALGSGIGGEVWVGTGMRGRMYSLGARGFVDIVSELPDDEVLSISGAGETAIVSTGLGASIYLVDEVLEDPGAYESDVMDAGAAAFWGELTWEADGPPGTAVRILTRSGNTDFPDESWSPWSEISGGGEGRVESPPARFLQWRAELDSDGALSPVLRSVEAAYRTENLPPRVGPVFVHSAGEAAMESGSGAQTSQTLPGGVEVTYSLAEENRHEGEIPVILRGIRTVEWDALDPNGDELEFGVWIRSDEETEWKLLADSLRGRAYTWDSASMPDGRYRMRVVGSDGPSNAPSQSETGEGLSDPFVVDNGPPELLDLELDRDDAIILVSGVATDRWTQLLRVEVSLDYGEWERARATDGSYDSREESFEVDLETAAEGELAVAVRAIDRAGNVAVLRQVLR